ncbi:unnamed protein product [Adineta ricciae]|uniref:Uncharacterized protein n=1 Tax=Adineta ricciae TaxID=249248 RepID=A0A815B4C6_ADIRI|nr:unnamed protein product [Adineta ricciae]
MIDSPWKYFVSSYEILTCYIKVHWNWYSPLVMTDNDDITSPTIDDNSTAYMSNILHTETFQPTYMSSCHYTSTSISNERIWVISSMFEVNANRFWPFPAFYQHSD